MVYGKAYKRNKARPTSGLLNTNGFLKGIIERIGQSLTMDTDKIDPRTRTEPNIGLRQGLQKD